jgi:hypothetical protein
MKDIQCAEPTYSEPMSSKKRKRIVSINFKESDHFVFYAEAGYCHVTSEGFTIHSNKILSEN